ncbi:MAG TPA: HAD-IIA family hydrolase [Patescibacteria group bacterium]|nr:HAD-IIA family hydrolase [Patescibacteria group bacterium]
MGAPAAIELNRPTAIYPGYVLDLDGTVYLGAAPLPGAVEAIATLRAAGSRFVFLSNNPLERSATYAARLRDLGVPVEDREVVSSIDALLGYLAGRPAERILAISEPLVANELRAAGHDLTDDPSLADAVVLSWDRTFTYEKLHRAFIAIRAGARLIATNADPYCPTPDGGLPDCGALLAAVEVATGVSAEAVVGKPSEHIAAVALDRLALPAGDVVMVGDRILTDVAMAQRAGMVSALVLTGATTRDDLRGIANPPDFVLERLDQLVPAAPASAVSDQPDQPDHRSGSTP